MALGSALPANVTETHYLIFLKQLSHGFKKPIQALLHTPAPNPQRCIYVSPPLPSSQHLTQCTLPKNAQLAQARVFGSQTYCSVALLQSRQFTQADNLTYIYLLHLGHPITLSAHLQQPDLLTTSQRPNLLGKLIFSSFPPSA